MLLDKINEHYEKIILNHFETEDIEITSKGLLIKENNPNIIKLHKICKIIPNDLVLNHIETIIAFGNLITIPKDILILIDSLQEKFKEDFFLEINKNNENYKFTFYHKEYEYIVYSFIESHLNINSIKEKIELFTYKDIKLPKYIIEKILNDIELNFLNGYDIDFSKYRKELILASKEKLDDYMAVFTNEKSGKQILVHPLQINLATGDVFFAGRYENYLKS